MSGVLHHGVIGTGSGRHHDAHIDTAGNRFAECIDRFGLWNEIRILNPDALAGEAYGRVVENFHGWWRTFGLDECRMNQHVAFWFKGWKYVVPNEQFARFLDPVLAECGLHTVHDGPAQSEANVGDVFPVFRIAQPVVDYAMAAHERFAAVDDDELAMVPVVQHADIA